MKFGACTVYLYLHLTCTVPGPVQVPPPQSNVFDLARARTEASRRCREPRRCRQRLPPQPNVPPVEPPDRLAGRQMLRGGSARDVSLRLELGRRQLH